MHLGDGPTITLIELDTQADVPNLTEAELQKHADTAKKNCPVSKALTGPEVRMQARLLK